MDAKVDDDRVEEGEKKGKGIDGDEKEGKMKENGECLIDIEEGGGGGGVGSRSRKVEKLCRICHFSKEPSTKELELITLGCACKGELASSHHHCAQAWFTHKGDRICEICGKMAKNVKESAEERSIFMMEWNEMRMVATSLDDSHESSSRCKRLLCNLMLAALLLVFLFLWFCRGINLV